MPEDDPGQIGHRGVLGPELVREKKPVVRSRVSEVVRRSVVKAVIEDRLNGAQAARVHNISDATVHRILKAERIANPLATAPSRRTVRTFVETPRTRRSRRALTTEQEQDAVERLCSGAELAIDIAREFGVHKSTISRLWRAAKAQSGDHEVVGYDPVKLKARVAEGVARAAANGRLRGRKTKFSPEIQDKMVRDVYQNGAKYAELALEHNANLSTIRRLVRRRRLGSSADHELSLSQIFSELMGQEGDS